MGKTEDYLDELLNSIEEDVMDVKKESGNGIFDMDGSSKEQEDYLSEFEKELLSGEDADEFLRQFEQELAEESKIEEKGISSEDDFFDALDGIVNSAQEKVEEETKAADTASSETSDQVSDKVEELSEEERQEVAEAKDEGDVLEDETGGLMELMQSEQQLSDLEESSASDHGVHDSEEVQEEDLNAALGEQSSEEEGSQKKGFKRGKRKKKEKPVEGEESGFWKNLSLMLFGEDDGEEDVKASDGDNPDDSNAFDEEESEKSGKKKKKEKKKKEKKPKPEKPKKPKKQKAPKPPKEPDRTPPLPKVPVILIFVMAGSFLALVMIGMNLVGYAGSMSDARNAYAMGDYVKAYQCVSGAEVKDSDVDLYERYKFMADIAVKYEAYQGAMEAGIYDMGLDSLVRTVGKCEKYRTAAEEYGFLNELEELEVQANAALEGFGINREQALELYIAEDREEYSKEIYRILSQVGFLEAEDAEV